jgi:NAD(P)H-flavin reductase
MKKQDSVFFINKQKTLSSFGDRNPTYAGSVVKALQSAKEGSSDLINHLHTIKPKEAQIKRLQYDLKAVLLEKKYLAPNILELVIRAPLASQNFKPGQFFKLQNYVTNEAELLEPIALTGAWVDKKKGIISLIVLQNGLSTKLCSMLNNNEAVILLGPSGEPTEIPKNEKILLIGGGLGNAVLFSIGKACKENKNEVIYIAAYKTLNSRFKEDFIEESSDRVFWACEEEAFTKSRKQDETIKGNVIDTLHTYIDHLHDVDRIMVIGSDKMMKAIAYERFYTLKEHFSKNPLLIGSINAPMQCMMKGICGQCVQLRKNSATQEQEVFFACQNQDQNLEMIDFNCLNSRLKQNSLLEKINNTLFSMP